MLEFALWHSCTLLFLFSQQFIRKRGFYRWMTHQCIFWGVLLSCAIIFLLTFGWLRFTQTPTGLYQIWIFGFPFFVTIQVPDTSPPAAAHPAAKNLLRTTEGGEES